MSTNLKMFLFGIITVLYYNGVVKLFLILLKKFKMLRGLIFTIKRIFNKNIVIKKKI